MKMCKRFLIFVSAIFDRLAVMGVVFWKIATGMVFPEEQPDDCCNNDFDEDRSTTPRVCGHGNEPLSQSGTRHYENRTNNNNCI